MLANPTQETDTGQSTFISFTELRAVARGDLRPWDNSDPFFSAHTREWIQTVFACNVRPLIILLGIPGNIVSCLVFFKQGLSDRINLLLFWLAVADLSILGSHSLIIPSCFMSDRLQRANWDVIWDTKLIVIIRWVNNTSGALIMIMSVDRCLTIAMPLKAKRLLTYRPMAASIFLAYLIPFALYLNLFLAYSVKWKVDSSTNRSVAYMARTSWFPVDVRIVALASYLFSVITKPIFLSTVGICCTVTIKHLRQASCKRLQMVHRLEQRGNSETVIITKMLLFLCVVYAVLLLPQFATSTTYMLIPEFHLYSKYHNTRIIAREVLVLPTSCLNSAVNFFAYVVLSSRFRGTLKELFRSCHRKSVQPAK